MLKKSWALIITGLVLLAGLACAGNEVGRAEYKDNNRQLEILRANQPLPDIQFSNTRDGIIKRLVRWNNPDKISYIYLLSHGRVITFYPIKGNVVSLNSYVTPLQKPWNDSYSVDAPDIDGTYGWNEDGIFFYTTEDVYVEWNGEYMLVDQPLQLSTQPDIIYVAPLGEGQ